MNDHGYMHPSRLHGLRALQDAASGGTSSLGHLRGSSTGHLGPSAGAGATSGSQALYQGAASSRYSYANQQQGARGGQSGPMAGRQMYPTSEPAFHPSHSSLLDRPQSVYGGLAGLMQHRGPNGSGSVLRPRSPMQQQQQPPHGASTSTLMTRPPASRDTLGYNMSDLDGRGFGGALQLAQRRQEAERQHQEALAAHLNMRHQGSGSSLSMAGSVANGHARDAYSMQSEGRGSGPYATDARQPQHMTDNGSSLFKNQTAPSSISRSSGGVSPSSYLSKAMELDKELVSLRAWTKTYAKERREIMDRLSELQVRSEQMKREMALYETKLHGKDQHDGEVGMRIRALERERAHLRNLIAQDQAIGGNGSGNGNGNGPSNGPGNGRPPANASQGMLDLYNKAAAGSAAVGRYAGNYPNGSNGPQGVGGDVSLLLMLQRQQQQQQQQAQAQERQAQQDRQDAASRPSALATAAGDISHNRDQRGSYGNNNTREAWGVKRSAGSSTNSPPLPSQAELDEEDFASAAIAFLKRPRHSLTHDVSTPPSPPADADKDGPTKAEDPDIARGGLWTLSYAAREVSSLNAAAADREDGEEGRERGPEAAPATVEPVRE